MKKFWIIWNKTEEAIEDEEMETMIWLTLIWTITFMIAVILSVTGNDIDIEAASYSGLCIAFGYSMYITKIWTIAKLKVEREETEATEG